MNTKATAVDVGDATAQYSSLSVVIPTYRRPEYLTRCLDSLIGSVERLTQVCVVCRGADTETHKVIQRFEHGILPVERVLVERPGQVAALNAGLLAAAGELLLILDDDTVVNDDAIRRTIEHLQLPSVGGAGVRDRVIGDEQLAKQRRKRTVGIVQWHGRTIGNHHRGQGGSRDVDVLKGAYMAYRRDAIEGLYFDERLRGEGAQIHNDLAFSLNVRKRGYRLIYDGEASIEHHLAPRMDRDQRNQFNEVAYADIVHNHTLTLCEYLSPHRRMAYLVWGFLVGTRGEFGLVQVLRHLPSQRWLAVRRGLAAWRGRMAGIKTYLTTSRSSASAVVNPSNPAADHART